MPSVNELFSDVVNKTLVIDSDLRTIKIPSSITNIGVESDDGVTVLPFRMPRYYNDFDLSEFRVRINYHNAKREGDIYTAKDVVVTTDTITFSWEVERFAVMYKGNVNFIVCLKKLDNQGIIIKEFNTTTATLPVLEGLEIDEEAIVESQSDAISSAAYEAILLALDNGLKGDPGYTPVKGVDYYTADEREEFAEEVVAAAKGVYANAYKKTVSGEVIRVDDVSPLEHTVNVSVRSKNLIPYPYDSIELTNNGQTTVAGLTYTDNKDGSIYVVGTVDTDTFSNILIKRSLPLKDGVTYYMGNSPNLLLAYKDALGVIRYLKNQVFTWSKNYEFIQLYVQYSPDVVVNETLYPMICVSDAPTEYEPYIDPSTVTLTRCGKNLIPFPYKTASKTINGISFTVNDNGSVYISGTATTQAAFLLCTIDLGETTIVSVTSDFMKGNGYIINKRLMYNHETKGVYIVVNKNVTVNELLHPQVEVGSTVTDYEPYKGATYKPNEDGTCDIVSVSPTMTLLTDTVGVVVNCTYSRDNNKVIGDISSALDILMSMQEDTIDLLNNMTGGAN